MESSELIGAGEPISGDTTGKKPEDRSKASKIFWFSMRTLSFTIWVYALVKLFIFDIDVLIINNINKNLSWILNFKILAIMGLLSIMLVVMGRKLTVLNTIYLLLYAPYAIFLKMPYNLLKNKNWVFTLIVFNSIAEFIKNFRYKIISFSIVSICIFIVCVSENKYALSGAIVILICMVTSAYVRGFIEALNPSVIVQVYRNYFPSATTAVAGSFSVGEDLQNLPISQMQPKDLEKWNQNLQIVVLYNRIFLFISKKLRDYQKSEWRILPSIAKILSLVIFSVIVFGIIFYALFKYDASQFRLQGSVGLFDFIYFSVNNLIFNSTNEIEPISIVSRLIYMMQVFFSFSIAIIFVTIYISNKNQRMDSEIDEVVSGMEFECNKIEAYLSKSFQIDGIDAAMKHLKDLQYGLISFIYWLSDDLDEDK